MLDHDRETLAMFCFKIATAQLEKNAIFSGYPQYLCVRCIMLERMEETKENRRTSDDPVS